MYETVSVTELVLEIALSLIVVPWCIWVTVSIFQQKQETALLKQIFLYLKENLEKNRL